MFHSVSMLPCLNKHYRQAVEDDPYGYEACMQKWVTLKTSDPGRTDFICDLVVPNTEDGQRIIETIAYALACNIRPPTPEEEFGSNEIHLYN